MNPPIQQLNERMMQQGYKPVEAGYTDGGMTPPPKQPSHRRILLEEATKIVDGERNQAYGNPEDNFSNIAKLWNVYLEARGVVGSLRGEPILCTSDVAHLMILMKMARLSTNLHHRDSLVDIAGYAACAADCL